MATKTRTRRPRKQLAAPTASLPVRSFDDDAALADLVKWWAKSMGQLESIYLDACAISEELDAGGQVRELFRNDLCSVLSALDNASSCFAGAMPHLPVEDSHRVDSIIDRIRKK